jgi:fungal nitric oxide reductase
MHRKRGSEQALGFGFGEHQCVAEWLARAELEIVFGESLKQPILDVRYFQD